MKLHILLLSLLCSGAALAQELAGRVLVAAGDVAILRGGQRATAGPGAEVRTGDTIFVGENSSAQIRLTDESLISFQPRTTFEVTEYSFQGLSADKQRAVFRLVLGGMRTITGLIGRLNQANYRVNTPTSAIGIRGTHYTLAHRDEFRLKDGSTLPGGTYGAVTDGRISVSNQAGESVFGADQYFRVASPATRPEQLIRPPTEILSVRAERRQTAQQQQQQQAASTASQGASGSESAATVAQTGTGGGTGDSRVSSSVSNTAIPVALNTSVFQASNALSISGPATVLQPTLTGTVFYRLTGPFNLPGICGQPPCSSLVNGNITLGVNLTLQLAGVSVNVMNSGGDIFNLGTPSSIPGIPITISNGVITFSQTLNRADHPQNLFAFRCNTCAAGGGAGFMDSISVSGTISGSQAVLTLSGTDAAGTESFTATLTEATPPNNAVAASTVPTGINGVGGNAARSSAFWGVNVEASGRLLSLSAGVGTPQVSLPATAANVIKGSDPAAGNLVWGVSSTSTNVDVNYAASSGVVHWITGTAPNTLPPSLGTLSFTPVGYIINNGNGTLNSASLTADFVARSVALSLNATNFVGNAFQMNGTTSFNAASSRFASGFQSVTCSGSCGAGTPGGSFAGFFAGANAEGAGVVFSSGFAGNGVFGAVGFKR